MTKQTSNIKKNTLSELILTILNVAGRKYRKWMPDWLRSIITPNYGYNLKLCKAAAKDSEGKLILDAGAANRQYKKFFKNSKYESTDINDPYNNHTFRCSLESMPVKNSKYDTILCIAVLEHIKNPKNAISEFYRILKPGGKLFLSVPLQARFHSVPHHYFNFTESGLKEMLTTFKFENIKVTPNGGAFHFIITNMSIIPQELFMQMVHHKKILSSLILFPFIFIFHIASLIIGPLLYILDFIDIDKHITTGYTCICEKGNNK